MPTAIDPEAILETAHPIIYAAADSFASTNPDSSLDRDDAYQEIVGNLLEYLADKPDEAAVLSEADYLPQWINKFARARVADLQRYQSAAKRRTNETFHASQHVDHNGDGGRETLLDFVAAEAPMFQQDCGRDLALQFKLDILPRLTPLARQLAGFLMDPPAELRKAYWNSKTVETVGRVQIDRKGDRVKLTFLPEEGHGKHVWTLWVTGDLTDGPHDSERGVVAVSGTVARLGTSLSIDLDGLRYRQSEVRAIWGFYGEDFLADYLSRAAGEPVRTHHVIRAWKEIRLAITGAGQPDIRVAGRQAARQASA
jgi:hypothetical protein